MPTQDPTEQFVSQLTEHQNRLYAYIFSLLGDHGRSSDVLQETNLVLWRKLDQFDPQRPFLPWAMAFARFQVLASVRDAGRDRLLLDPDMLDVVAKDCEAEAIELDRKRAVLRGCLDELAPKSQQLIRLRYFGQQSVAALAESTGISVSNVKVTLMRVRRKLGECIERQAGPEAST